MLSNVRFLGSKTHFQPLFIHQINASLSRFFATKPKPKTGLPPGQNTVSKVRLGYQRKLRKMAEDRGDKAEMSGHVGDEITKSLAEAQSKNEPVDLEDVRQLEIDRLLAMMGASIDTTLTPAPRSATNGTSEIGRASCRERVF